MAVRITNKRKNEAIIEKVKKILDSADFIDSAEIFISIARGEVTTIKYNIKEFITPEDDKKKAEEAIDKYLL